MSRHLVDSVDQTYYFIVGFDRPLNEYFYQRWLARPGEHTPVSYGAIDEIDDLRKIGVKLPDALAVQLLAECCGQADTNMCKDRRGSYVTP